MFYIFFLVIFLVIVKFINFRKLYFYLYFEFTKFQSYFDQRYRTFLNVGPLSTEVRRFYFFYDFFFLSSAVPFAFLSGHFYFFVFSPRNLVLHTLSSTYFVYFFFFVYFRETRFRVYNFFNNRIFFFL